MKLEFTFEIGRHRFKCVNCGKCCYPAGITITRKEYQHLIKVINQSAIFTQTKSKPFTHILETRGRCPFLTEKKLCAIYEKRPIMCILFPLTLFYLPDGRLIVNFVRCEGYDLEDGEIVDQEFVFKVLEEIKDKEPNFLDELIINSLSTFSDFVPFYTQSEIVSYDSKLKFNAFLADVFKKHVSDRYNFRAQAHAFIRTIKYGIDASLYGSYYHIKHRPILVLDEELNYIKDAVLTYFEENYDSQFLEIMRLVEDNELLASKTGVCELYLDGDVKKVNINEVLSWKTYPVDEGEIKLKVAHVYYRKKLSVEALSLLVDYIAEVLRRVGLGGFPIDAPISITLQVLGEYINNLEFYYNLYSGELEEASLDAVKRAIQDLDTNFVLGSIYMLRAR